MKRTRSKIIIIFTLLCFFISNIVYAKDNLKKVSVNEANSYLSENYKYKIVVIDSDGNKMEIYDNGYNYSENDINSHIKVLLDSQKHGLNFEFNINDYTYNIELL